MGQKELFTEATKCHQAGEFALAGELYRQVLAQAPNHPPSLHLLGVVELQMGHPEAARELIGKAVAFMPENAEAHGHLGRALLASGRIRQAIAAHRIAVKLKPDYPPYFFDLASALQKDQQYKEAIELYKKFVAAQPELAWGHLALGNALALIKDYPGAILAYRKAIEINPNYAEAFNSLASALQFQQETEEAVKYYKQAIDLKPDYADAHANLGVILENQARLDEAIASYQRAIEIQPDHAEAHNNLGNVLAAKGQVEKAVACYQRALQIQPKYVQAMDNLGNALQELGQYGPAVACYREALKLEPHRWLIYNHLGNCLRSLGQLDDAMVCFENVANAPAPDEGQVWFEHVQAYNNLANTAKDRGDLDASIAYYRRALELKPSYFQVHSNLIYTLHFHPDYEPKSLLKEHLEWARIHAEPQKKFIKPLSNDRSPDRKLKIGYVSPDFRNHCQSFFTLPVLKHHDRQKFEVYCYASVPLADSVTQTLRDSADHWRDVMGETDFGIADKVRQDGIDILVDLTMHMANGRTLTFAVKPAPVQVAWLAYPGTTGMDTMDYRLTDPYLDPSSVNPADYTEKTIKLPDCFWCFDPPADDPEPAASLPALSGKPFTFGCLNNFCKINESVLSLWSKVLAAVPKSNLLILAPRGQARQKILYSLAEKRIDPARIDFVGVQSRIEYLKTYHRIDLCLDTFPSNGHTTSLDALWMGVPVVSRADGKIPMARGGISILMNAGLKELLAQDGAEFIKIAAALANDLGRLSELRSGLRHRLQRSPLMDGPKFTRNLEAAYRQMWKQWCQKPA